MALPLTSSKRPFDHNPLEPSGKGKWQKIAPFSAQQNQMKASPGATVFRVLCPASKSGSVIGKGGGIVTKIRQETGAKIRIEETVPGCEERVVVITGSDKETEVAPEQSKEDDEYNDNGNEDEDDKESDENPEEKELPTLEVSHSDKAAPSAQKALLLVFERIVESDSETDVGDEASRKSSSVVVRLLVSSSQVGCLLGKGGSIIKKMASESGAHIRILPRDKLPACASPLDELVQISGGLDAVRKALQSVSQKLLENPPRDGDLLPSNKASGPSSHPFASHTRPEIPWEEVLPPPSYHLPDQGLPYSTRPHEMVDYRMTASIPRFPEHVALGRMPISPEPLTFRLTCTNDKVGSVIGKGGNIVRMLQQETGCEIKVIETGPESEDRIVVITGPVHPDDRVSPVQDALLRVHSRIVMAVPDNKENIVSARLVVSSNQTGCLLGKGGAIVTEMRKLSGAQIRILSKDQIPKFASENEEVVHVTGEFEAVQEALLQITSRLKHHIFRDKFPAMNHPGRPAFVDQVPPFASYMGRREPSPPGSYSKLGPSFPKFDSVGGLHDERSAFPRTHYSSGVPPHGAERIPPSAPWALQGISDGGGLMGTHDYAGGPQRRLGGFAGGSQPAIITNTTVDVVVPRALVPSIYGEDGGCLKQIRQISGARITITEPRPGASETVIIISGAPAQTHAAQSLIQAFVLSGSNPP